MRDSGLGFMKMHGLGNDFVVLDGRVREIDVTPDLAICDRVLVHWPHGSSAQV
jgi:diaminopimelate epimerase